MQYGRPAKINSSTTSSNAQGYELSVSVTMNQLKIINRDKAAASLVQQITDNNFENVKFSYDELGYPTELAVTVYTNCITKFLNRPAFRFFCKQEVACQYDIVTSPEKFLLTYE